MRFPLTRLVRSVVDRLTTRPATVGLATLEVEVRDVVVALGRDRLTELVRPRGTGYRGPSDVCPCGVRLTYKEVAPLQQRTWCGPITLERAVYAGDGFHDRAHHVPLDAESALLGAVAPPTILPDPDGGTLAPVAPGEGPARLAPAFAAPVVEFGARGAFAEAARLLELAVGPQAHLAPNTVGTETKAAGRARAQQKDAGRVRTQPPTRAERQAVFDQPVPERPASAPDTLVITLDGAMERTQAGWNEVKLGAIYDLVARVRQGQVVRMPGATAYAGTLATAQTFGRQLLAAAQRRGLG